MSDDITFCGSECNNKKCFRHPSNIAEPNIPHSLAYLKDTDMCPMKKQEIRLIDAEALKKALHNFFDGKVIDEPTYILRDVFCHIDNAPTVCKEKKLHGGWIPVKDKLPDTDGYYLVTEGWSYGNFISIVHFTKDLKSIDEFDFYGKNGEGWYIFDGEYGYIEIDKVVAWQPLPEPYKKGGAE